MKDRERTSLCRINAGMGSDTSCSTTLHGRTSDSVGSTWVASSETPEISLVPGLGNADSLVSTRSSRCFS